MIFQKFCILFQIRMTNFTLCVVTTDLDKNISINADVLHSNKFVYSRLVLIDDVPKCSSSGRLSTIGEIFY